MAITLEAFGWRAVILPSLGGAMASLHFEGEPVLRSAGPDVGDILDCASFPLVPFANRIGHGLLRIGELTVQLDREPVALPHAHHGHGWRSNWQVDDVSDRHLTLVYDHPGQGAQGDRGWPWPYRAEQRFVIHPACIRIDMAIINRDPHSAMPCGIGTRLKALTGCITETHSSFAHKWRPSPSLSRMCRGLRRIPGTTFAGLYQGIPPPFRQIGRYFEPPDRPVRVTMLDSIIHNFSWGHGWGHGLKRLIIKI